MVYREREMRRRLGLRGPLVDFMPRAFVCRRDKKLAGSGLIIWFGPLLVIC